MNQRNRELIGHPSPASAEESRSNGSVVGVGRGHHQKRMQRGQNEQATISPKLILLAIAQWWKVAIPAGLLMTALSCALIIYTHKPQYRAAALLEIKENDPYIVALLEKVSKRFESTQTQLLRSALVLEPVIDRPDIAELPDIKSAPNPLLTIGSRVFVSTVGGSELYRISYTGYEPRAAAVITNAIVDQFLQLHDMKEREHEQRVIELLEEEKANRAEIVYDRREQVKQLGKKVLGKDPFAQYEPSSVIAANQMLSSLQSQLTATEVDRQVLTVQIKALEESIARETTDVPQAMIDAAMNSEPEIQQLKGLIQSRRLIQQQIEAASAHGRLDPAYQRIEREIERYEETLDHLLIDLQPRIDERIQTTLVAQQKVQLAEMQARLSHLDVMEGSYRERYEDQLLTLGETGSESLDFKFAQAELAREESVYERIASRIVMMRTEQGAPERITLLAYAKPPLEPIEHLPYKMLLIVTFCCFSGPFVLAIAWEQLVQRVNNAEQLEDQAALSVIGEISRLPSHRPTRTGTIFEESIDSLRTYIVLSNNYDDISVLAVTSAIAGEGKTSVSSQLAVSIARSTNEPTLLVDADLRSPDVHRIFGIENRMGLCDLLDGQCTVNDVVISDWDDRLHLLPAGRLEKSPHKLMGNGTFKQWINELRSTYRYIVIDTPPVLSASESLVIAKEADAALICTMRDFSRTRQTKMAYQRLMATGARPIGAVLNGVSPSKYAGKYGTYGYTP